MYVRQLVSPTESFVAMLRSTVFIFFFLLANTCTMAAPIDMEGTRYLQVY